MQFLLCAGVILFAGTQLSRTGDLIADKTGLGKNWVGLVLLASVTSLPELLTSVSAVTFNDLPDMAVSGIIGSCMFNMIVIAMLDVFSKGKPVSHLVHQGHIISAGFGIILVGFAAIAILFDKYLPVLVGLHSIDPLSIAYIVVYLIAMKLIYSYEKTRVSEFVGEIAHVDEDKGESLTKAVIIFLVNAVLIVGAAYFLPELAEKIAASTGWSQSFIGSSFIAITTSLPEITVSVTAARMGSFDMAVANLLGSNLFNIAILAITDFSYVKGPLLRTVSQANAVGALAAIICMGIVVIGLTYRTEKKLLFVAGDAIAIVCVYAFANYLLFNIH